jgi:hypothetical protein
MRKYICRYLESRLNERMHHCYNCTDQRKLNNYIIDGDLNNPKIKQ